RVLFIPSQFRGYDYERMAQKLRVEIPTLEHVFVVGAVSDTELASSFDKLFLADGADLDLGVDALLRRRLPAPDDAAMLVFTSGTTGTPKAAVHTHNTAWAGYSKAIVGALKLTPDDTAFMASTLGHL